MVAGGVGVCWLEMGVEDGMDGMRLMIVLVEQIFPGTMEMQ